VAETAVFRLSSDAPPRSSAGLQARGPTLAVVFDLAAIAIGAACFAAAFALIWVLSRV